MRNYPNIISNLKINEELATIAKRLGSHDFVLGGRVDEEKKCIVLTKANYEEENLTFSEHNAKDYLEGVQERQLIDLCMRLKPALARCQQQLKFNRKIDYILIGLGALIGNSFAICLVSWLLGKNLYNEKQVNQLYEQLELDIWACNYIDEINSHLHRGDSIYDNLTVRGKEALATPEFNGSLNLNNIEKFPVSELRYIHDRMQEAMVKEQSERQKALRRLKGM